MGFKFKLKKKMSNKKGQKIINEISEKLKKTIKKYNEISINTDLSLQKSNDINEIIKKSKSGSIIDEGDKYTNSKNERNISFSNMNYTPNNDNTNPNEIIDSRQNAFVSQINQIMKSLNTFEDDINNDFDELEEFVENEIEKELATAYR